MQAIRGMLGRLGMALLLCLGARAAAPAPQAPKVCVARIQGTIGPATASYVARALGEAAGMGAQCLVIQLDTPGGLLDSTKEIIQSFLRSPLPTVVYVSPPGAWAGSAGCFITLAADVAAMAPTTSIGAAHPVQLGAGGAEKMDETMKQKLENFTSSYIEAIAARRHRNTEWARASVRESASITAEQALAQNVVDYVAADLQDLLRQVDGRVVNGAPLHTAGAQVVDLPLTMRERFLQGIAHPQVMLVLMLVVMYGVIGELTSPGAILPGVAGLLALVLLLYLGSILPMNAAGLALVLVAIALFILDVFTPTHAVLTAGGIVAFFLGTFMLFDRNEPFLRLSLAWLVPATVVTAGFFVFVVGAGIRAQRQPARTGAGSLVGRAVTVLERIDEGGGRVFVDGEYWTAVSPEPLEPGQRAEVVAVQGLVLKVKPADPPEGGQA
jgi:membrane-bound serine protease (ClpP class)